MSIKKSYYKVSWTRGTAVEREHEFNDENQEIRYCRQSAIYKFLELKNDIHIRNAVNNKVSLVFYNHYVERDFDQGMELHLDCAREHVLFEAIQELVNVNFSNWEIEANEFLKADEFYIDELAIVLNENADAIVVLDDRLCKAMNMPYSLVEDIEELYSLSSVLADKRDKDELIKFISENNGFKVEELKRFSTETLRRAYHSGQGAYVYLNAVRSIVGYDL
jgi:hypothetical protein